MVSTLFFHRAIFVVALLSFAQIRSLCVTVLSVSKTPIACRSATTSKTLLMFQDVDAESPILSRVAPLLPLSLPWTFIHRRCHSSPFSEGRNPSPLNPVMSIHSVSHFRRYLLRTRSSFSLPISFLFSGSASDKHLHTFSAITFGTTTSNLANERLSKKVLFSTQSLAAPSFPLLSPFLQQLQDRGLLYRCTADLSQINTLFASHYIPSKSIPPAPQSSSLASSAQENSSFPKYPAEVSAYWGIDATANALHIGHLLPLMVMRWLQRYGHRPILLLGGTTSLVGDPSGKDTSRRLLEPEVVAQHIHALQRTLRHFFRFDEGSISASFCNNADWLSSFSMVDFMRHVGKHISVNTLLKRESIRRRLSRQQPLSLLELQYSALQAFDFVEVHRRYGASIQIAGADQWGNILAGIDLADRLHLPPLYGITTPLLLTSDGRKMGKSTRGALWLDSSRVSPYAYWQYWRNTADTDVLRFLRYFTELPIEMLNGMQSLKGTEFNEAKILLADETTRLLHGETAIEQIKKMVDFVLLTPPRSCSPPQAYLPSLVVNSTEILQGMYLWNILILSGLSSNRASALSQIKEGSIRLNGCVESHPFYKIQWEDFKSISASNSSSKSTLPSQVASSLSNASAPSSSEQTFSAFTCGHRGEHLSSAAYAYLQLSRGKKWIVQVLLPFASSLQQHDRNASVAF